MLVLKRRIGLIDIMIDWMIERKQQQRVGDTPREKRRIRWLVGMGKYLWGGSDSFFFRYLRLWLAEKKEGTCV